MLRLACLLLLWSECLWAELLPTGQVESVLLEAARRAEQELAVPRPLPDISKRIGTVIFGIPLELGVQARNVTQVGPRLIQLRDPLRGEKSTDGKSLLLEANLHLQDTRVIYNYLLFDFFGYKFEGTGFLQRESSVADLTLQFHPENIVEGCSQTTAVVSQPDGFVFFTLGSKSSGTANFISHILDIIYNIVNNVYLNGLLPTDLLTFLFPDEQDAIMNAFSKFHLGC